jgi:hypothetical protein
MTRASLADSLGADLNTRARLFNAAGGFARVPQTDRARSATPLARLLRGVGDVVMG